MRTKVSTNGQVVLPSAARRKLGLKVGDLRDVTLEAGRLILAPTKKRRRKARIIKDPISGLPALTVGNDAPVLTSTQVRNLTFST